MTRKHNKEDFYFDLGLAVLDLSKREWEAGNKEHTKEDVMKIGEQYETYFGEE